MSPEHETMYRNRFTKKYNRLFFDAWKNNDLDTIKQIHKSTSINQLIIGIYLFIVQDSTMGKTFVFIIVLIVLILVKRFISFFEWVFK